MNGTKTDSEILKDIVKITRDVLIVNKDLINKFASLDKKVKSIDENVDKKVKSIDENVGNKIDSKIAKYLGIKWESLQVILAAIALQLLIVFYFNDIVIKSSIQSSMIEYNKILDGSKTNGE